MRGGGIIIILLGIALALLGWLTSASEAYSSTVTFHRLFIKMAYIVSGGFCLLSGTILYVASAFLPAEAKPAAAPASDDDTLDDADAAGKEPAPAPEAKTLWATPGQPRPPV